MVSPPPRTASAIVVRGPLPRGRAASLLPRTGHEKRARRWPPRTARRRPSSRRCSAGGPRRWRSTTPGRPSRSDLPAAPCTSSIWTGRGREVSHFSRPGEPVGQSGGKPQRNQRRFQRLVPRKGLEPSPLARLVPETSASTNSATWASVRSGATGHHLRAAILPVNRTVRRKRTCRVGASGAMGSPPRSRCPGRPTSRLPCPTAATIVVDASEGAMSHRFLH